MTKFNLKWDLNIANETIEHLMQQINDIKKQVNGPYDYGFHKEKSWQKYYEEAFYEIECLNDQLKKSNKAIESFERQKINIRNNNLEKTDLLGEKIEALQDEINHLKGLKLFYIISKDEYGSHTIKADKCYEDQESDYTICEIKDNEIFRIKTSLITSISTKEF